MIETGLRLAERHGFGATALRARLNRGVLQNQIDPRATVESDRIGLAAVRRLGQRRFAVLFLTNSAAVSTVTGEWDVALPELEELLTGDLSREDRILVLARLTVIQSWRGEPDQELLDDMDRLAGDTPDLNWRSTIGGARASREFAHGRHVEAATAYRRLVSIDGANARHFHFFAARASLMAGDAASAAEALEALEALGVHGPFFAARRTSIRAGLAALDGRPEDALALYREANTGFRDLGVQVEVALTGIEMATLLDPAEPDVRAAAEGAREILEGLRARPLIDQLEAALLRAPGPSADAAGRHSPTASALSVEAGR